MTKVLDFRFKGSFDPEIANIFNKIAFEFRPEFNNIVSKISRPHLDNLDWWVEGPASRNSFASPFFHNLCCLLLLKHLINSNMLCFHRILVDSSALKIILTQMFTNLNIKDCKLIYKRTKLNIRLKRKLALPLQIIKKLIQLLIARYSGKINIDALEDRPLILVDTFMLEEFTNEDRWYGEFWNNLSSDMKVNTFFIPTIVNTPISRMLNIYKSLRHNPRNFLIKEDFLSIKDIFKTLSHFWNIKKIMIEPITFHNCEINSLIKEELLNNSDKSSVIESLLSFSFVRNLRKKNIEVGLSIDWFEGQAFDKSWSYSFHAFYPETTIVGYRAFHSYSAYLCSFPIPIENEAKCLPDVIAVQGKGSVKSLTEFFPNLKVRVIPSFKSAFVWDFDYKYNARKKKIMCTLPISIEMSTTIIKKIYRSKSLINFYDKKNPILIKPHPTHNVEKIKKIVKKIDLNMQVTDEKSFSSLLNEVTVLISDVSSTCLEAMACGIPVIVMTNTEGLLYDPVPSSVPSKIYYNAENEDDLAFALNLYIDRDRTMFKELNMIGQKIRNDFFEPITQVGLARFLNTSIKKEE